MNIVRNGPVDTAGSRPVLISTIGATTPTNDVARVADNMARNTASPSLNTCGSLKLIRIPITEDISPQASPRAIPTVTSESMSLNICPTLTVPIPRLLTMIVVV